MRPHWTLDDIPWDRFDPSKVDIEILRAVKAASLVERNADDYVAYLEQVFPDDHELLTAMRRWGAEENQHGEALAQWCRLADPDFDFAAARARFAEGFQLPQEVESSVRGSRAGELIARCIVETGTSSFYSAIRDATDEPVLKAVCNRVAGDEFRHYKLFYDHYRRYQQNDRLTMLTKLRVALGRIVETSDDELPMAYYCANALTEPYDRRRHGAAYASRAYGLYREGHVQRAVAMVCKACDIDPQGRIAAWATRAFWFILRHRTRQLSRIAA